MKKIIMAVLMVLSFNLYAAEATVTTGAINDRATNADGSSFTLNVKDDVFGYGVESTTIANVIRTQGDASYYIIDAYGVEVLAGFGGVTKTDTKSHMVYFGKANYTYTFPNRWAAMAGISYRNDFDTFVLDKKTTATIGAGYNFSKDTYFGGSYSKSYGDEKHNTISFVGTRRF